MELTCVSCKKLLCHQTADGPIIHGHYLYDDKAYCAACWEKVNYGELVNCLNPKPD